MKSILSTLAVISLFVGTALPKQLHAQSRAPAMGFWNGNQLYQFCSSKDGVDQSYCVGYILGVSDAQGTESRLDQRGERYCLSPKVTGFQLKLVVMNFLNANPQHLTDTASDLVHFALLDGFPCRDR